MQLTSIPAKLFGALLLGVLYFSDSAQAACLPDTTVIEDGSDAYAQANCCSKTSTRMVTDIWGHIRFQCGPFAANCWGADDNGICGANTTCVNCCKSFHWRWTYPVGYTCDA